MQHLTHNPEWDAKWKKHFLTKIDWAGKRVVDYGIGGGYLGEKLFSKYSIGEYVGVDISQKSLDTAKKTLQPWKSKAEYYLTDSVQDFGVLRPDIFVSQEVIQHFPTVAYFDEWLANVDRCGAREVMLHFRQAKHGETVDADAYRRTDNKAIAGALKTTLEYIIPRLPHYRSVWSSESPMGSKSIGVYSGWVLKDSGEAAQGEQEEAGEPGEGE